MFAYCQNNPANYFDPSGNAALMTCHADADMFLWGGLSYLGFSAGSGGGGSASAAVSGVTAARRNEANNQINPVDVFIELYE